MPFLQQVDTKAAAVFTRAHRSEEMNICGSVRHHKKTSYRVPAGPGLAAFPQLNQAELHPIKAQP